MSGQEVEAQKKKKKKKKNLKNIHIRLDRAFDIVVI